MTARIDDLVDRFAEQLDDLTDEYLTEPTWAELDAGDPQ